MNDFKSIWNRQPNDKYHTPFSKYPRWKRRTSRINRAARRRLKAIARQA